ncbi:uncharacterized protein TRIADDRAFT_54132 [Trichoplax adhaerens]|uniref:KxDL domain-containing protein n=1 Tax=Trichoplax adhaerens TaxID=10228 RepID=B3RR72_TRIAD|nr:hypothetical protein TRIADDRAFT_54132 [Trichoplax adhaerens]EDV26827.1 hypothetical protein TRIADDRAFT_54132 [Trichoplax adhaerens]|eukprot:XP_002110823.1 hypothetical protein TRIADDRAFT_54132 [Trichoplax adhaerens]
MADAEDQGDGEVKELSSSFPSLFASTSSTEVPPKDQDLNDSSASEIFCRSVVNILDKDDVDSAIKIQRDMISRVERANAVIENFNRVGKRQYEDFLPKFREHTNLIIEMKKDLDNVFKRIR